eukprot:1153335-Rhodomonas_salina.2
MLRRGAFAATEGAASSSLGPAASGGAGGVVGAAGSGHISERDRAACGQAGACAVTGSSGNRHPALDFPPRSRPT